MRGSALAAGAVGGLLMAASATPDRAPRLAWNVTPSAPTGLYLITPGDRIAVGDIVAFAPDPPLAAWLDAAGYAPSGALLLKQVAAAGGARVCRQGAQIEVNGRRRAVARARDGRGRALPAWAGCRRLRADEVLLLNAPADSLDSRYFGAVRTRGVVGTARRLGAFGARGGRP